VVFTVTPRVLVDVEPLCRSCKKPVRKDCKAAVLAVVSADDDVDAADDAAADDDDDVPVLELPDVVPPRSAINFENAVFNSEIALDDSVEGAPAGVEELVVGSLLLSSLMREESADVSPLRA
jgi:hypothetical protein